MEIDEETKKITDVGATVLGDGTVALIVDMSKRLDKAELAEAVFD